MARPGPDKGKDGSARGGDKSRPTDEVGPRKARWSEPRPRTPLAIALDYKKTGDGKASDGKANDWKAGGQAAKRGPRVSASGRGAVAEQILEIAFAKGIPVREDADLAQILSTVEVDSVIPVDALAAVAEILSYLYRLNGRAMDGKLTPEDMVETGADMGGTEKTPVTRETGR
jgi:flagellar biosynthesis protein